MKTNKQTNNKVEATAMCFKASRHTCSFTKTLEAELADAKKKRNILQHVGALKTDIFTLELL